MHLGASLAGGVAAVAQLSGTGWLAALSRQQVGYGSR